METYRIIYKGILEKSNRQDAEEKFAALFKLSPEKTSAILSRPNVALRSNLDKKTADLFHKKLTAAGIDVLIRETTAPVTVDAVQAPKPKAEFTATPIESGGVVNPRFLKRPENSANVDAKRTFLFSFHGSGPEYFRIWIVNTLLTIVTLGIYSAWAKVRTEQYFHANTELEGSSFQYQATPRQILRGRGIAAVVFGAYFLAGYVSTIAQLIVTLALVVAAPALIVLSMSFRLRYSAWKNVNFDFNRDFMRAYKIMALPVFIIILMYLSSYSMTTMVESKPKNPDWHAMLPFIASMVIFYFAFPWMQYLVNRYLVENAIYGNRKFNFASTVGQYYKMYAFITVQSILLAVVSVFLMIGILKLLPKMQGDTKQTMMTIQFITMAVVMLPIFLWYYAYTQAKKFNLRYQGASIGRYTFSCDVSALMLVWLYVSNTIAILCTLGVYIPWAKVRTTKYRLSCLKIDLVGAANSFYNSKEGSDATAHEMAGFFDIDIAI